MPKRIPTTELDALVATVAESAAGVGIAELRQAFPSIPRRTLQRRLARLVREGRLVSTGRGRALRYRVSEDERPHVLEAPLIESEEWVGTPRLLALSRAGSEVRRLVDRPDRKSVV